MPKIKVSLAEPLMSSLPMLPGAGTALREDHGDGQDIHGVDI
jgi:hypothetical protein